MTLYLTDTARIKRDAANTTWVTLVDREDNDESGNEESSVAIDKDDKLTGSNKNSLEDTKKKIQKGSVVGG